MKMMCDDIPKAPSASAETIHGTGGPCDVHANQLMERERKDGSVSDGIHVIDEVRPLSLVLTRGKRER